MSETISVKIVLKVLRPNRRPEWGFMRSEENKVFYSFGLTTKETSTVWDRRQINTMKKDTTRDFCFKKAIPDITFRVDN